MTAAADGHLRVVVVDDHHLLRQGVITALSSFDGIEIVGEGGDGPSAVRLAAELRPDVMVLDLIMPGGDGVSAIQAMREDWPEIKVLALSSFTDPELVRSVLSAGATSYITKIIDSQTLVDAVRATAGGRSYLAPEVMRQLTEESKSVPAVLQKLTKREAEVAELLAEGHSNAEIAQTLVISLYTVKNHVSNVLTKLHVGSRSEAGALIYTSRNHQKK